MMRIQNTAVGHYPVTLGLGTESSEGYKLLNDHGDKDGEEGESAQDDDRPLLVRPRLVLARLHNLLQSEG
jgi:hypothetical protein